MWQNITSLFNKAALSVLVISNILPEILVLEEQKKNPLQVQSSICTEDINFPAQNNIISLELTH